MSGPPSVQAVAAGSDRHRQDLAILRERGIALPHDHAAWPLRDASAQWQWVRFTAADGSLLSALAVELRPSRAAPGLRIGRIRRFGRALHRPLLPHAGELLTTAARRIPRLLRLDLELFDDDEMRRAAFQRALGHIGWYSASDALGYRETLRLDIRGRDDEALLAGCNSRTRRNIRRTRRESSLRFAPVTDSRYTDRIIRLHRASFERSGGHAPTLNVTAMLADSGHGSILLGGFDARRDAPDDLIAFAWITLHGDHACYSHAGSMPLASTLAPGAVLMWEAIRWSRDRGLDWFDFGGVTPAGDDGPLAGISTFKRGFGGWQITVGETLSFTAAPLISRLIRTGRKLVGASA